MLFGFAGYISSQSVQFKELDFNVQVEPALIEMDTSQNSVAVASVLADKVNLQFFTGDSLSKTKEVNIPMQLGPNEKVADLIILNNQKIGILLKTYTQQKIFVKFVQINAPGLISKPKIIKEMVNRNVELVIRENNSRKAVNNQVHIETSPSKHFISIVNRQNLVCTSGDKGLEVYNYNRYLESKETFKASNCAYKDLHIFNNGRIGLTQNQQGRIVLDVYEPYFASKLHTYLFPEIIERPSLELTDRKDTFDQQVQFFFDDKAYKTYAFIKGFVNNNYISHVGLYVYDIKNNIELKSTGNLHKAKDFVRYSIAFRDHLASYNYEYPMHLKIKHVRMLPDKTYEVLGDYMSYGRMPLGNDYAGMAKSEATYLIHLNSNGALLETKILLHRQSIISYPNSKKKQTTYQVDLDRVDNRVGQLYMYNDTCNYILHNNDKKAFYSVDRHYRFTYFGTDGSVALVNFASGLRQKSRYRTLDEYELLPMQTKFNLSPSQVICFALEKKKVKLIKLSLAKQ